MNVVLRGARQLVVLAVVASACTGEPSTPSGPPPGAPSVDRMLRDLGGDVVTALVRGYHGGVSTDVAFVPKPHNVVVRWSGQGLGTDLSDPRTTHPTPWDYHQRVPIVLYGPGHVRPGVRSARSLDVADLPATFTQLTEFPFGAPDSDPLREAVLPGRPPPQVIVLVAYDGGGWNLLEQWPRAWPFLRQLMAAGAVYTNATIGSAPAVTSAIHATMGTGVYPRTHGVSEITARRPDGSIGDVFFGEEADPRLLKAPTFADTWDAHMGNRSWNGLLAYESWHLGMMGRGSGVPGGDRDVAVLWEQEPGLGQFFVNESLYTLPDRLPGDGDLDRQLRRLDGEDGAIDGSWRGYDLTDPRVVPATPAFVRHQGEALVEMIRREPVGEDAITDLLFVELKPTDFGGHLWNMVASQEAEVLRAQDDVLRSLVAELDRKVGQGRWVLAFTADHGQTPKPETTGGLRIHPDLLGRKVEEYFGRSVVEKVTPTGLFLDHDVLGEAGIALEDVARFVADIRYGDALPSDVDRSSIP
ncbi:MAG TPA: alkaline phosphatase family protein, partial [Actinomycetota bacterium]|nr:alkaline phosphatase family protein [Actinomycetota bacterium]